MIKTLNTKSKNFNSRLSYFLDLRKKYSNLKNSTVKKIVDDIRKSEDKSLIKYEKKFNKLKILKKNNLLFSEKEIKKNLHNLDSKVKRSIDLAFNRILTFHKNQKLKNYFIKDKFNNKLSYRSKPIEKVGVYVPGGNASYPSSVLMNCIPARVAGVKEIYMTVPCLSGKIKPAVLFPSFSATIKVILPHSSPVEASATSTKISPNFILS